MWDKVGPKNRRGPWLLQPDNFTPARRTPWGGRRIVDVLKRDLGIDCKGPVGEAWELSVEPDFPSRLADGQLLDAVLHANPSLLGREAQAGSTALLVKLVDAADDLSLQIHPADDDASLEPGQSGKPEAWYIIDAEPGAGLYLGFKHDVSRQDVARAIGHEARVDNLMCFVPVSAGDLFLIEPGTPHAIGKGVLLIEPQRVAPGKRGVTYRYWDWNRRYDSDGQPDPQGQPRELHASRALEVTNWEAPRETALLDRIRYSTGPVRTDRTGRIEMLASPSGPLRTDSFIIVRLTGCGEVELSGDDRLRSLTVLSGSLLIRGDSGSVEVARGQTVALPASSHAWTVELDGAHAISCSLA
jgi:mannose-6-phosphate isomerase class I